ncbi:hypothetical protein [Pelagicoccus sp. SDUM812003]|uniref:hypothetical protein n=1 Tax=Pelagicoccus sp. SDUM812003 TaxID=3041267 RepID=UPI00280E0021|nr:hypothetical protein [Pelagicoccus sp. SDUM812003]MDQ8205199.1 hypothetical protein [Pelagicoccus sp. SDUM812003]
MNPTLPRITLFFVIFASFVGLSHAVPYSTSDIWINEFHYDNIGGDTYEFVEIAYKNDLVFTDDHDSLSLELINGDDSDRYGRMKLGHAYEESEEDGFKFLAFRRSSSIQNGPDGVALVVGGELVQFLSYGGIIHSNDWNVDSSDIGLQESNDSTQEKYSLQLAGSGYSYEDFSWIGPAIASPGGLNAGQELLSVDHSEEEDDDTSQGPVGTIGAPDSGITLLLLGGGMLPLIFLRRILRS